MRKLIVALRNLANAPKNEVGEAIRQLCLSVTHIQFNKRIAASQETLWATDLPLIPSLSLFCSVITLNDGVIEPAGGREPLSFPADRTKQ